MGIFLRRLALKFSNMRFSSRTTHLFGLLKEGTGLGPNVLARFALCISLKQRGIPNPDEYNREGSEFTSSMLFGYHEPIYLALMINRLKHDKLDVEEYLNEMTRSHINRGAISLRQRVKNLSDFHDLIEEIGK